MMSIQKDKKEKCRICLSNVSIDGPNKMKRHLLEMHSNIVAELIESNKHDIDPIMQWIFQYIPNMNDQTAVTEYQPSGTESNDEDEEKTMKFKKKKLYKEKISEGSRIKRISTGSFSPQNNTNRASSQLSGEKSVKSGSNSQKQEQTKVCKLCNTYASKSQELLHILQAHLAIVAYRCNFCDYKNAYNMKAAMKHALRMHAGKQAAIIDETGNHQAKINILTRKCFGKSPSSAKKSHTSVVVKREIAKEKQEKESARETEDISACDLCGISIFEPSECINHAWNIHRSIIRRVQKCSHCSYSTVDNRLRIETHIRKSAHPNASYFRDLDTEFYKLLEHCFGRQFAISAKSQGIHSPNSGNYKSLETNKLRRRKTQIGDIDSTKRTDVETNVQCLQCSFILPIDLSLLKQQHVYRDHLNRPLFRCSDCPFSNKYRPWAVQRHINFARQSDRSHFEAKVLDVTKQFKDEIRKQYNRCFIGSS